MVVALPEPDLGVQGCGAHSVSGREFNLFKPLRRHFRVSPLCRQALPRRDQNGAVQETDDRLSRPGLRQARHAPRLDPSVASGSSGNGKSFDGTGHSAFSFRAAERNKRIFSACRPRAARLQGRVAVATDLPRRRRAPSPRSGEEPAPGRRPGGVAEGDGWGVESRALGPQVRGDGRASRLGSNRRATPHPAPGLFDPGVAAPPGRGPGAGSSPASWGRPRGNLRCVNTAGAPTSDRRAIRSGQAECGSPGNVSANA